ncbi:MAG: hypothetical protein Q8O24_05375 [Gallionellaceae bacterium]|nr:hypothetical protein [Gallionellaceae bacterium]
MSESKEMTGQQKLAATQQLLDLLDGLMPSDKYHVGEKMEVLMLAYHASAGTHQLRCLVSSIS